MKKWKLVLVSEVTDNHYTESTHRFKWQATRAMRRHRLYRQLTWQLFVERAQP